jgi:hypothetical protein
VDAALEDDAVARLIALFVDQVGRIAPAPHALCAANWWPMRRSASRGPGALSGDDATAS